jgi:GGDEF domain-containing protein
VFYKNISSNRIDNDKIPALREKIKKIVGSPAELDKLWKKIIQGTYVSEGTIKQTKYDNELLVDLFNEIKTDFTEHIEAGKDDIDNSITAAYIKTINNWIIDLERHVIDTKSPLLSRDGAIEVFSKLTEKFCHFGVVYLDISSFKMFNDVLDHKTGDDYLRDIGELIEKIINGTSVYEDKKGYAYDRGGVFAARDGGDEFYVFVGLNDIDADGNKIDGSMGVKTICNNINEEIDEKILTNLKNKPYRENIDKKLRDTLVKIQEKKKLEKWEKGLEIIDGVKAKDGDEEAEGLAYRYISRCTDTIDDNGDKPENEYISIYSIGKVKHHTRLFTAEQFKNVCEILEDKTFADTEEEKQYIIADKLAESVELPDIKRSAAAALPADTHSEEFYTLIEKIFEAH